MFSRLPQNDQLSRSSQQTDSSSTISSSGNSSSYKQINHSEKNTFQSYLNMTSVKQPEKLIKKPNIPAPPVPRINTGTYTKSSLNLSKPETAIKKQTTDSSNIRSIFHTSFLNKSVDNLNTTDLTNLTNNNKSLNITPEMTQQLLLQLLLQQISSNLNTVTESKSNGPTYQEIQDSLAQRTDTNGELSEFEDSSSINPTQFRRSNSKKFMHKKLALKNRKSVYDYMQSYGMDKKKSHLPDGYEKF